MTDELLFDTETPAAGAPVPVAGDDCVPRDCASTAVPQAVPALLPWGRGGTQSPDPGSPPRVGTAAAGGEDASALPAAATSTPTLEVHVTGLPAPQGSKRAIVNQHTGRAQVVESSKKVKPWRQDVKYAVNDAVAAREGTGDPFATLSGEVGVDITFMLPRPRGHFRTGRNAHLLRDSAPKRPTTKPDVDKLLRSTLDALRDAGVFGDDSQVVTLVGRKVYATHHPGAVIQIFTGRSA